MRVWLIAYNGDSYTKDDKVIFKDKDSALTRARDLLINDKDCDYVETHVIEIGKHYALWGCYTEELSYVKVDCREVEVIE